MSKKMKIVLIAAAVLMLVFALTACGNKAAETPWEWAQSLEDGDIESAVFWCTAEYYEQFANTDDNADAEDAQETEEVEKAEFEDTETELSSKLIGKLLTNFYRLEESNFTEVDKETDSPLYGITITMKDGTEYTLNQSDASAGALEMTYADKQWVISGAKLNKFVEAMLSGEDIENTEDDEKDENGEGFASAADLIASGSDLSDPSYGFVTYSDLVE